MFTRACHFGLSCEVLGFHSGLDEVNYSFFRLRPWR